MILEELRAYIEQEILPRYDHFDAAHRRDHATLVIRQSMELSRKLGTNEAMCYTIAAYHDTGLSEGRETHHIVSGHILRKDKSLRKWFSEEEIETMAQAAEDHRASSKTPPRSIYGRIVAEADRFIDPQKIIERTIQYGLDHYPALGREEHWQRTLEHLKEKYGEGGYLKLWFEDSPNTIRLEALRTIIKDEARLRQIFDTSFPKADPMGQAIMDYHRTGKADSLRVLSPQFDEDEIPVSHLFRTFRDMPKLEKRAIREARGRTLDIGAGAGCHSLELQQRGLEVTALEISPLSCQVMRERGVRSVEERDILQDDWTEQFDTILLLMNGLGIAGKPENLPRLLNRLKKLLKPGGQILTDSCDLRYIFEDEDGQPDWDSTNGYYGALEYQMIYKDIEGNTFPWLYADAKMLAAAASETGLQCEILDQGDNHDFLARIS